MSTTISLDEVEKFSKMADEWWDPKGKFKPLHLFNPIRLAYIRQQIENHFDLPKDQIQPFKTFSLLDIGCGGGLLSEPMARLGANVTAIDAAEKNIKTAHIHAEKMGLSIDYKHILAEELVKTHADKFDIILNMEVIEHVADPQYFMSLCSQLLKPGGILFVATLNRTIKSFLLAIMGAEYILRWLPIGTHDWNKFLKPKEIEAMTEKTALNHIAWQGVSFNPLTQKWSETTDLDVNYMGLFNKNI